MSTQSPRNCTLITGATGGIGRAFAFACARGGDLFLTGRSEQKLAALRAELAERFPGCTVACFACDLTDAADRARLFAAVKAGGWRIFRLCNVAGADIQKAFCRYTQEKIAFQCRINFEAALCVTRFALENRVGTLEIVTVGSISGVYPMPYFAVYSAAKGALESFFTSLREEVRGQRVNVTTVEPGGVYTRPDVCRMIEGQGLWGKLSAKTPEYVAAKSLRAVRKNKRVCLPGFWNKVVAVLPRILPRALRTRFIARRWSKLEKDAF